MPLKSISALQYLHLFFPLDILPSELSEQGKTLLDQIKRLAKESKLSYVEINKALYLADEELYIEKINS